MQVEEQYMNKHLKHLILIVMAFLMAVSNFNVLNAEDNGKGDAEGSVLRIEEYDPSLLPINRGEPVIEDDSDSSFFDENDVVSVFVVLEETPVLDRGYKAEKLNTNSPGRAYMEHLKNRQSEVLTVINKQLGTNYNINHNFTLFLNAFTIDVKYKDIAKIVSIKGIKCVEIGNKYYPASVDESPTLNTAFTSEHEVGAQEAWEQGYTGIGTRIAIIDTGIDLDHQSFDPDAFIYSIKKTDPDFNMSELMDEADLVYYQNNYPLNSNVAGENYMAKYINAKIPYVYNYWFSNHDSIDHSISRKNHGSHVAGIAAANRYVPVITDNAESADYWLENENGETQYYKYVESAKELLSVGISPDSQLIIMNVFGGDGVSASEAETNDEILLLALEDAIMLECDACNVSIGNNYEGFSHSRLFSNILNKMTENAENYNGMVVTVSAGNNGSVLEAIKDFSIKDVEIGAIETPGSFENTLAVASSTPGRYLNILDPTPTDRVLGFANGYFIEYRSPNVLGNNPEFYVLAGEHEYVFVEEQVDIDALEIIGNTISLQNKIVMIYGKGNKIGLLNKLTDFSPLGVVLCYKTGTNYYLDLEQFSGGIPVACANYVPIETFENDEVQGIGDYTIYMGDIRVYDKGELPIVREREENGIYSSSAWGINSSLLLKPDITAPGEKIYSVNGRVDPSDEPNSYVAYTGTSMAAPHIAGLSAILKQYINHNQINLEGYSTRAIIQSLLMSTATPMINASNGQYYPVFQQGAGLADVSKAIEARTVIMMESNDSTLTAITGAAKDGKIKVELGDDPEQSGKYSYSFNVFNITDEDVFFNTPYTDIFTQDCYIKDGQYYMSKDTTRTGKQVSYTWTINGNTDLSYDINKDGCTDDQDVQSILDYMTGVVNADGLNLSVADIDGDNDVTSRDAYLLLAYLEEHTYVPANGYAHVTVTFSFEVDKNIYVNGAYIEGFTCLTEKGGITHSIPILGFYGNWSKPSMIEHTDYIDYTYNHKSETYVGDPETNLLKWRIGGKTTIFRGNPYHIETEYPLDKLAITSSNYISYAYSLIRSASASGIVVEKKVDGEYVLLDHRIDFNENIRFYYYHDVFKGYLLGNNGAHRTSNYSLKKCGLRNDDIIRISLVLMDEYFAMNNCKEDSYYKNGEELELIDDETLATLFREHVLDEYKYLSYEFVVDNEAPTFTATLINNNTLYLDFNDNNNLASVEVMSMVSDDSYYIACPASNHYGLEFDLTPVAEKGEDKIIVFAGDYAGNEIAYVVFLNQDIIENNTFMTISEDKDTGECSFISFPKYDNDVPKSYVCNHATFNEAERIFNMIDIDDTVHTYYTNEDSEAFEISLSDDEVLVNMVQYLDLSIDMIAPAFYEWQKSNNAVFIIDNDELFTIDVKTGEVLGIKSEHSMYNGAALCAGDTNAIYEYDQYIESEYYYIDKNGGLRRIVLTVGQPHEDLYRDTEDIEESYTLLMDTGLRNLNKDNVSLYYDGEFLYLTHFDGDKTTVYIVNTYRKELNVLRTFTGQRLRALFEYNVIPTIRNYSFPVHTVTKGLPGSNELFDAVSNRTEKEIVHSTTEQYIINNTVPQLTPIIDYQEIDEEVVIKDAEWLNNGLIEIHYDTSSIYFDTIRCDLDYRSIYIDRYGGIIRIAFAVLDSIPPEEAVASLHFVTRTCLSGTVTVEKKEKNGQLGLSLIDTISVEGHHTWKFGKYEWTHFNDEHNAYVLYRCSECKSYRYQSMHMSEKTNALFTIYTGYLSAEESLDGEVHQVSYKKPRLIPRPIDWEIINDPIPKEKKIIKEFLVRP